MIRTRFWIGCTLNTVGLKVLHDGYTGHTGTAKQTERYDVPGDPADKKLQGVHGFTTRRYDFTCRLYQL